MLVKMTMTVIEERSVSMVTAPGLGIMDAATIAIVLTEKNANKVPASIIHRVSANQTQNASRDIVSMVFASKGARKRMNQFVAKMALLTQTGALPTLLER